MIYRLRYCNKNGVEARVDIQKGLATPVIEVEGTGRPFILSYNNDKGNKSGLFLSSSADIEVYETPDFNIDNLKTSNETELSVTYYIDNVVKWKGFIIPDFFSIEVRNNPVIVMTASDRIGTLKNVTLTDLPTMVNIRELAIMCLNKTGLSLPLNTIADFSNDGMSNAFFNYYIDSQRIKDIKGRSISCYDILSSILIAINSKLVQREGEWVIINKLQHEIGSGNVYSSLSSFTTYLENIYNFQNVSVGARRTITPVAGSIGIYHEHGGRKSHPANYDFSLDLSGWNSNNGFVATIEDKHITGYLGGTPMFDPDRVVKQYLLNYNNWIDNTNNLNTAPYISTDPIPINSPRADRVEVTVDISSTMAEKLSSNTMISFLRYAVILTNGTKTYTLTKAGIFEELDPENISGHSLLLRGGQQAPLLLASPALSNSETLKGLFEVGEEDNVNDYSATIRIYGSGDQYVTVNYALIKFSDVSEIPKGTIYKVEQGEVFTKAYDVETSIFGDYLLSGLNGYFYRYPNDDTSSIYKNIDTLSNPVWTTPMIPNETSELPLLHHSARQMRRLFSVAHDLLSVQVEADSFDPLAVFVDCNDRRYTVVSAQFDFFRSSLSVELEEVAYQNNIIREFIYSYFGEGESNIKSIGGIAGGGGGTGGTGGGGMTSEQLEMLTNLASWWKLDEENDAIYSEKSVYSLKGVSALGLGSEGGGGSGDFDRLDAWADYDSSKSGWVLSALLGYDLHTRVISLDTRVTDLELNSGSGTVTSVGLTVPTGLSVSGSPITSSGTLAISLASGYSIPTTAKQGQWDTAYSQRHTHSNKVVIDALTQGNIDVLNKLSLDEDGNVKVDATLWATGGISALGLGEGGSSGGGGVDMLQSWETYNSDKANFYVPASLLVPFRSDTLDRLTALESGSATTITTTGSGNAITSISKSGNVITANKGTKFAELGADGLILTSQLPSYVDDVLEFATLADFPTTGESGKIYVATNTNLTYRWTGTTYVEISKSIALGETSSTAYRGDRGKIAYEHSQAEHQAIINGTGFVKANGKTLSYDNTTYEPAFSKNTAFNKNFGTTAGTVAQGNDSRIINGQTAFGWGNHASAGYALSSALSGYVPTTRTITAGNGLTGGGTLEANRTFALGTPSTLTAASTNAVTSTSHTHAITTTTVGAANTIVATDASGGVRGNIIRIGANWTLELSGTELVFKYNGVIKQRMLSDGTILATGGVTALATS